MLTPNPKLQLVALLITLHRDPIQEIPTPLTRIYGETFNLLATDLLEHLQSDTRSCMQIGIARINNNYTNIVKLLLFKKALKSSKSYYQKKTIDAKIYNLTKRDIQIIIDLSLGRKAVKDRQVYRVKIRHDNQITRYKAR